MRRQRRLDAIRKDFTVFKGAQAYYLKNPCDFISDWVDTYDPRLVSQGKPASVPFVLYPRQREMVAFVLECIKNDSHALIEKSRDVGATWVCAALSVWLWIFWPGVSVGWGSRKEMLVDRIGDPSSIFEKMRMIIESLPVDFLPEGLDRGKHLTYLRLINPINGSSIIGEAGDQIGRGGRTLCYFKDESAHYERPERIEAALSDNTRCQIDISSVSGMGTVFHRKREAGKEWEPSESLVKDRVNVFIFDWRHHPEKTEAWYNERLQAAKTAGLMHIHAQEVDRDYAAALQTTLIKREWVRAAINLHEEIPELLSGKHVGALDVANEGGDRNALAVRKGLTLLHLESWGDGDTGKTARRAVHGVKPYLPMDLQYDSVGVGAGVKAESNRLADAGEMPQGLIFVPWNAGAETLNPRDNVIPYDRQSPTNEDHYANLRAQAWWDLRFRLERAFRVRNGDAYPVDDLISFSSEHVSEATLYELEKELCQVQTALTARLKQSIDKMPEGVRSPNLGDAVIMAYFPLNPFAFGHYIMKSV